MQRTTLFLQVRAAYRNQRKRPCDVHGHLNPHPSVNQRAHDVEYAQRAQHHGNRHMLSSDARHIEREYTDDCEHDSVGYHVAGGGSVGHWACAASYSSRAARATQSLRDASGKFGHSFGSRPESAYLSLPIVSRIATVTLVAGGRPCFSEASSPYHGTMPLTMHPHPPARKTSEPPRLTRRCPCRHHTRRRLSYRHTCL